MQKTGNKNKTGNLEKLFLTMKPNKEDAFLHFYVQIPFRIAKVLYMI